MRPGGCLVRSGLLEFTLGIVRFVRGRWVHWGAPCGTSGSFGVVEFIGVRSGGRRVRSGSLDSYLCALGVVGFVRDRWVH